MIECFENEVRLEVVEDLVVAEVRVFWQVEDWGVFGDFVVFIVVNFNQALPDKVHLLDITLETNYSLSWCIDSAIHANNELISESPFALFEEMVETSLKLFKNSCVLNKIGLHFWCNLLVELKLLDDQVEIVQEGLLDVLSDVIV